MLAAVQQGGEPRMGRFRLPASQVVQHVEDGGHGIPDAQALDVGPLDDSTRTGMEVQLLHFADDEFHVAAEPFGEILDSGPVESVPFRIGIALQETNQCLQAQVLEEKTGGVGFDQLEQVFLRGIVVAGPLRVEIGREFEHRHGFGRRVLEIVAQPVEFARRQPVGIFQDQQLDG